MVGAGLGHGGKQTGDLVLCCRLSKGYMEPKALCCVPQRQG